MKIRLILILLILGCISYAQENLFHISGIVVDAENNRPLPDVNVFISNSTLGTASGIDGKFRLDGIKAGEYTLVFSMVGYKNIIRKTVFNEEFVPEKVVKMKLEPIELDEVVISSEKENEIEEGEKIDPTWEDNYRVFTQRFLGVSENADQCKILNPEALVFIESDNHELITKATEPLEILNLSLGYKLKVVLIKFRFSKITKYGQISYHPYFIELESKDNEQIFQWHRNRKKAYLGSLRHFLTHLKDTTFTEEGFDAKIVRNPSWKQVNNKLLIYRNFQYNVFDGLLVDNTLTKVDDQYELMTGRFFLQVIYFNEEEERNFTLYKENDKSLEYQVSWIYSNSGKFYFNEEGNLTAFKENLNYYGYWSWKRIADKLPIDFIFKKNK